VGNAISPELEKRLIANIERTIELIEIQKEMKFALYKKLYPHKTESQLISLISTEIFRSKQQQP
jgi:propanediol dehydratase small subunit